MLRPEPQGAVDVQAGRLSTVASRCSWRQACLAWAMVLLASPAWAVPTLDTLWPETTKGVIATDDVSGLRERWQKTQLGQLMNDEVMQPFSDDIRRQIRSRFRRFHRHLGFSWQDLEDVASGEVSLAVIQPAPDDGAVGVLADVEGNAQAAQEMLEKIGGVLTEQGATLSEQEIAGTTVRIYELATRSAPAGGKSQVVLFHHQDVLGAVDHLKVASDILSRLADGSTTGSLHDHPPYRAVVDRVAQDEQGLTPDIRWFADPFAYIQTIRTLRPPSDSRRPRDFLKILGAEGFPAIQALGGSIHLYVEGQYEILHRTSIYAPRDPEADEGERFQLSARMLSFPNGDSLQPLSWIPRDLATFACFQWDVHQAFDAVGTLVDRVVGEDEVWADVQDQLLNDPHGPKISLRDDLVANLGHRMTVITDNQLPITPQCERLLVAVEARNLEALASTIDKVMEAEPNAELREVAGHRVWEIVEEEEEELEIKLEAPAFDPLAGVEEEEEEAEEAGLPNSAVCVARGHLLVATHMEFLADLLHDPEPRLRLEAGADYQAVAESLDNLLPGPHCFRYFSRTEEELRPTYELIRQGKMPESETVLGKILNAIYGDAESEELREQKIDGTHLPNFEVVRRYFGPSGLKCRAEEENWVLVGTLLSRRVPPADMALREADDEAERQ